MIYCCIHGCKCPCESCCTCCDKENDPQLQYEVKNGSLAAGIGNDAFVNENDNASHNGSQRPLYEKHLPEDKFTKNPAVWYENNFTKELHRTQNVSLISHPLYFSNMTESGPKWMVTNCQVLSTIWAPTLRFQGRSLLQTVQLKS